MLFTATLLSLIQRSSHRRLQSHSRNAVWNSLETNAALKDPVRLVTTSSSPGIERERSGATGRFASRRLTHRDFRDTRLSKVPGAIVEKTFPERFLRKEERSDATHVLSAPLRLKEALILTAASNWRAL